ncbi:MAG: 50S ribosomal protein L9 [Alphaproteobacteria bacterium]
MQVILLERVEKLGNLGDTVSVKPGFARNYLLPQGKALRATKEAMAQFEAQKTAIEKLNSEKKADAEKSAKKIDGQTIVIIRSASDAGQLYGSVTTRDIAASLSEATGEAVTRNNVVLENPIKTIGYYDFKIVLHPEVSVFIKINVAQSEEEAQLQTDRVNRGEPAVITAAEEDAKVAAEIAQAQAKEMAEVAKQVQAEQEEAIEE